MDTYFVTFRIAELTIGGKTPTERRNKLVENVRSENCGYWAETTSFLIVESSLNTPDFSKHATQGLSPEHDMVVVIDPKDMSANYFGPLKHPEVLKSFLPKAWDIRSR